MDWEDRLDEWELELELSARLEGSDWVTLERAASSTGVSRAALRNWYRTGQVPSRLVDGPHGPQRLVPLAVVAARAEASPRLRRSAERRLSDEAQLEILRARLDQLELRLASLERRLRQDQPPPSADVTPEVLVSISRHGFRISDLAGHCFPHPGHRPVRRLRRAAADVHHARDLPPPLPPARRGLRSDLPVRRCTASSRRSAPAPARTATGKSSQATPASPA
jgi:hypothetical protein